VRLAQVFVFVCAALGVSLGTSAQTTGAIRGEVRDPSGALVQGAILKATLSGTNVVRSAASGTDGSFEIPECAVGNYELTAEASGFKKFVAHGVDVSIGHVAVLDITLEVGGSTQTVTVQANAIQVETTSTQLGAVMTDTAVRELPLSTRDTYQLLQLQPGV